MPHSRREAVGVQHPEMISLHLRILLDLSERVHSSALRAVQPFRMPAHVQWVLQRENGIPETLSFQDRDLPRIYPTSPDLASCHRACHWALFLADLYRA